MVEGTPLLREHTAYTRIEGSNPSISASINKKAPVYQGLFCFLPMWAKVVFDAGASTQHLLRCLQKMSN